MCGSVFQHNLHQLFEHFIQYQFSCKCLRRFNHRTHIQNTTKGTAIVRLRCFQLLTYVIEGELIRFESDTILRSNFNVHRSNLVDGPPAFIARFCPEQIVVRQFMFSIGCVESTCQFAGQSLLIQITVFPGQHNCSLIVIDSLARLAL